LIGRIGRGDYGLSRTFWEFMLAWGTLLNILATGASLIAFVNGAPAWAGLALHLSAIPYNLLVVLGVFRAAAREAGHWLQRPGPAIAAIWFIVMLAV
jgi:hypothetical protein